MIFQLIINPRIKLNRFDENEVNKMFEQDHDTRRVTTTLLLCHKHHYKAGNSLEYEVPPPADMWRMITSLLRQNDVAASFWRKNVIICTSCVRWVYPIFKGVPMTLQWTCGTWTGLSLQQWLSGDTCLFVSDPSTPALWSFYVSSGIKSS